MMKNLIKSFVCLFLITVLLNTKAYATSSINRFESEILDTPSPTVKTPIYLCQNSVATPLTAAPSGGGTLNWYTLQVGGVALAEAPTPNTTNIISTTYYVTQSIAGLESTPRTPIVVNIIADNGATISGLTCDPSQIAAVDRASSVFFDWSNNVLISDNSYNYSYTVQGGAPVTGTTVTSHWQVSGMLPGQSATLTLTATTFPCVPAKIMTCSVPCGASSTTPIFSTTPTSYCLNDAVVLPTTSTNNITGAWSPFPVDTSKIGTNVYTFTPDPISFPCAKTTTLSLTVRAIEPNFNDFSLCSGDAAPPLSNVSPNGINGTWNPPTVDNRNSGTYTFTPIPGQPCTPTDKIINVTINPSNAILSLVWTVTDAFVKNQIVTVTDPIGVNYLYQLDYGPFQTSPVFENVGTGTHSITVKDINGCSELTNDNVLVINYPKYFTPNGDGFNDTWNIFELSNQSNSRIYIFDRYGKLLKEISPNGSGWDGNYIGHPMPATDYWFTVEYTEQNTVKKFKSHFSLKR